MRVLEVKISDILSIQEASLSFGTEGLVLVEGWNYDDGRATGAGKTAIFNAVCFALYGKVPRKITVSEILRHGTKKGYVELSLQAGSDLWTVRRERPNKLTFVKNGTIIDITQEEFESVIKLTYDQFLISMYTAQRATNKFIDKNDSDKKDFLLQLMNLNEFNLCRAEADKQAKEINKEIDALKTKKTAALSKIDAYSESLIDPKENKQKVVELQYGIHDHELGIIELQKVPKPDLSKYVQLEESIKEKQREFAEARTRKTMLHQEYRKWSSQDVPFSAREPDANCPHCEGELNIRGNSVVKADDTKALQKQHEEHLGSIRKEMEGLKLKIDACDAILQRENEVSKLAQQVRDKKQSDYADYEKASKQISELRVLIGKKQSSLETLQKALEEQESLKDKISQLKILVMELDKAIDDKRQQVEVLEAVSSLYSSTGAQAYILDSIVDSFNESVSNYVDLVWPNATYKLNAFKEKKDGDVTAKFSESLVVNGKEKSIGQLSGGEFRALSLILDFSIIDILSKQFGMPLNPIILDEPFEGLDSVGRETVIELLEKLSQDRQIWVIDHASEAKTMFSKIMRVEKRQDISRIVEAT